MDSTGQIIGIFHNPHDLAAWHPLADWKDASSQSTSCHAANTKHVTEILQLIFILMYPQFAK